MEMNVYDGDVALLKHWMTEFWTQYYQCAMQTLPLKFGLLPCSTLPLSRHGAFMSVMRSLTIHTTARLLSYWLLHHPVIRRFVHFWTLFPWHSCIVGDILQSCATDCLL